MNIDFDKHHPFGPSRWSALAECPCYTGKPGGTDASRGTNLHAIFSSVIQGDYVDVNDNTLEANAAWLAQEVLRMAGGTKVATEEKVVCNAPEGMAEGFAEPIFGRFDAAWVDDCRIHVADLKMVENPDRDYTPQLVAYAFGLSAVLAEPKQEFVMHTLYVDTRRIKTVVMKWEELRECYIDLYCRVSMIAARKIYEPKQCGWCNLCAKQAGCPAVTAMVEKVSSKVATIDTAEMETWKPSKIAQFLVLCEQVAKAKEAAVEVAKKLAMSGVSIEDADNGIYYGLQIRSGKLTLDTDAVWRVCQAHGMERDTFVGCLEVSATKVSSALKSVGVKPKDAKALLEECGARSEPTTAFVRKGTK